MPLALVCGAIISEIYCLQYLELVVMPRVNCVLKSRSEISPDFLRDLCDLITYSKYPLVIDSCFHHLSASVRAIAEVL